MKDDKRRLYRTLNVGLFGFVEDDFSFDCTKAHVMLDFARMDGTDRAALLSSIQDEHPGKNELVIFANALSSWIAAIEWEKMPQDDIEHVLRDRPEIKALYEAVPENLWSGEYQELFFQYAVGATIPPNMKSFFSEVIRANTEYLPTRIYTNYVEETHAKLFEAMKACADRGGKSTVLVLDNMVGDSRLAAQMIEDLKEYHKASKNAVYATIFSTASKGSAEESCESPELYVGYVNKKDGIKGVHHNVVRAAINTVIQQYKFKYKKVIDENCDILAQNPDLVEYLYGMAKAEGETGYAALQQWISFMFDYDMENSDELVKMMCLSACIDAQASETSVDLSVPQKLTQAASSENFLSAVNKHCSATSPGDIFCYNDGLYVLVGQDCDYMMGPSRKRNAPHCELVSAELVPQDRLEKLNNDHKYVYISNYLDQAGQTWVLKINYTDRKIVSNEIINLCTFNLDGTCKIDYKKELDETVSQRVQPYLLEYYASLQKYFATVVAIQEKVPDFYEARAELKTTIPLIDINQHTKDNTQLDFEIRRISKLKNSASLYLYKMFLEYRGRMPYTTINLTGYDTLELTLESEENRSHVTMYVKLTNNRNRNRKDRNKLTWYVLTCDIQRAISQLFGKTITLLIEEEYVSLPGKAKQILECQNGIVEIEKRVQGDRYFATVKLEIKETADIL